MFLKPGHAPHPMPCWDMGLIHSPIKDQSETVLNSAFRHHVIIHNGKLFHLLWLDANHGSMQIMARCKSWLDANHGSMQTMARLAA